uniref:tRNA uridine 5-carboxymethylaminomethyl modification enzyme MnmG n=1 Tax=Lygus hesperus TaxID=30085 RepID=A0A0A9VW99_LYGHE
MANTLSEKWNKPLSWMKTQMSVTRAVKPVHERFAEEHADISDGRWGSASIHSPVMEIDTPDAPLPPLTSRIDRKPSSSTTNPIKIPSDDPNKPSSSINAGK